VAADPKLYNTAEPKSTPSPESNTPNLRYYLNG
jgi:hypothetical protein